MHAEGIARAWVETPLGLQREGTSARSLACARCVPRRGAEGPEAGCGPATLSRTLPTGSSRSQIPGAGPEEVLPVRLLASSVHRPRLCNEAANVRAALAATRTPCASARGLPRHAMWGGTLCYGASHGAPAELQDGGGRRGVFSPTADEGTWPHPVADRLQSCAAEEEGSAPAGPVCVGWPRALGASLRVLTWVVTWLVRHALCVPGNVFAANTALLC